MKLRVRDPESGDREYEAGRIFCIGRNYVEHVREFGNETPSRPVVFLKPATCLLPVGQRIHMPRHGRQLHHEAELVLLLDPRGGEPGWRDVAAVSLGLDLTLRDVQDDLKKRGLPWELAKAFEGSAPIGSFVPAASIADPASIAFTLSVGGQLRQRGDCTLMIFPVGAILRELAKAWELRAGDLVFTGTPAGVGPLVPGDRVEIESADIGRFAWDVV